MTTDDLKAYVQAVAPHSDDDAATLMFVADMFLRAHRRCPGRPSIEVGTRAGGSAYLFLSLLKAIYETPPFLFTVDPYGEKPSAHGGSLYGNEFYVRAKALLVGFENHAHFLLRSLDFFQALLEKEIPFWYGGTRDVLRQFAFAYLDGDHDFITIQEELDALFSQGLLAPGGIAVVDNVAEQARTIEWLPQYYDILLEPRGMTAAVLGAKPR